MTACGLAPLLLRFVTKLLKILVSVSVVSINSCQNVLGMLCNQNHVFSSYNRNLNAQMR